MPSIIQDESITFVVQGPVQASSSRKQISGITHQCLNSIRQYFPSSTIILSTWENQPVQGLDYDVLVESKDPGSNTIYHDDTPVTLNNNRQIINTHAGLSRVTTQYAVKIRTDNVLTGRQFVELYQKYNQLPRDPKLSYFKQRTLTSSTFFLSCHYGKPVHFHKSDLFDFGLTEDLLKIWPYILVNEPRFIQQPGYKVRYPATEQFLCLSWLGALLNKPLHINAKADDDAGLGRTFWPLFLANNIIIDLPEKLGLDVTERFYKRGNFALEYDLKDWLYLNNASPSPKDVKRLSRALKAATATVARGLGKPKSLS
ncbi:WavE lipopolysaccharide synthesis family protein [Vibrio sp. E150_011]